jgi:predicted NUDIX family phosphoesterase
VRRSEAEDDPSVVQLIAAGVHTHNDKIVVLERESQDKKAASYGRRTLWVGCHLDIKTPDLLATATDCLNRRIQQDLHLWSRPELEFLGLAWDKTQQETQHLGLIFRAPILNDYVANHLKNKQFKKMGRSGRIKSVFMTQEEIVSGLDDLDLEPWSRHIARNINLTQSREDSTS